MRRGNFRGPANRGWVQGGMDGQALGGYGNFRAGRTRHGWGGAGCPGDSCWQEGWCKTRPVGAAQKQCGRLR